MPMYEYLCAGCDRTTEMLRRTSAADDPACCEHCGGATRRMQSVFATGRASAGDTQPPVGPCGTCGDPSGSCGMA